MNWRVLIILLLIPSLAFAQVKPIQAIPEGPDRIVPLRAGQVAPFDGQLFDTDTSIRWGNFLQQYRYRLEWDVKVVEDKKVIELEYKDKVIAIEKERASKVEKDLTERLARVEKAKIMLEDELRNPPWYKSFAFHASIGVLTASLIFGVAIAAVTAAAKTTP